MPRSFLLLFLSLVISGINAQEVKFSQAMLQKPRDFTTVYDKTFNIIEIPVFKEKTGAGVTVLENGYVQHIFKNPEAWKPNAQLVVTEVNIVFTRYPKEKELWQTNYYDLLANRLKSLFALDSGLNSRNFEWNLVLQTDCNSEEQAKKLFHGIVIRYIQLERSEKEERIPTSSKPVYDSLALQTYSSKVERFIQSQGGFGDSVVMKVLNRNRDWDNTLVIMDWTGSMYQYGAQAVQWHILNFSNSGLSFITFFNDGDSKPDHLKVIGSAGGLYHVQASNIDNLINTFYRVTAGGDGGDSPENDLEAILGGMSSFKDFEELILIADNNSCVRDISLLSEIDAPVHVILCGAEHGINPQYVNIAYKTGGSLHTIEEDIRNLSGRINNGKLFIRGVEYQLTAGDLLLCKDISIASRFANCNRFETMHPPITHDNVLPQIRFFIDNHGGITDSVPTRVLARNTLWQEVAVVLQFTPETYGNAAQVLLWQKQNLEKSAIKYYALCNDGDSKKEREKRDGRTGGIYLSKANNIRKILNRFYYVEKRTPTAQGPALNAVEALMRTRAQYKRAQCLVLMADNSTCVRDIGIADLIGFPVQVILINTKGPINPQYINLVWKTGGSLHLGDEEYPEHLLRAASLNASSILIKGYEYVLNKNGLWEFKDKAAEKEFNQCRKYK
jgi:hypothetical protein